MKKTGYSRRNFVTTGSALAASAFVTTAGCQSAGSEQGKIREMLNVMDFGARGNETTDDTEALQKALDKAALTHGAV